NLSHDQTLQFTIIVILTRLFRRRHKSGSNLAQGFQTFFKDPKIFVESLALIFGDLSPSSASAHMNYLITLLKSNKMTKLFALSMGAYHTSFSISVKACQ
ncbi:hypothetical protein, partial [Vreelandella salicampi]|uniref:hypothetical protein n=1 Tax=Vreelandella salicampi TaxID=1449798 RepID=UPI0019D4F631